ncbi:MAG: ABC transporter ATP-binding protein, partial [Methylotenera sp.]|nr:ABC transporter ATP-binding protein [Methylotenera sp.]NOU25043.1 ABC transporter ATP-binding protein [Methylotenera sp.]
MTNFTVEAQGLTRLYGGREAVSNVSFHLSKGQVLGFLGPNGA